MSENSKWGVGVWVLTGAMLAPLPLLASDTGTGTQPGEYQTAKPAATVGTGSTAEVGTQPEEYGSPPKAKPKQKDRVVGTPGSPASVRASHKSPGPPGASGVRIHGDIPGTQPGEYAKDTTRRVHPYDTVHNVRIRRDTPHPDSVKP